MSGHSKWNNIKRKKEATDAIKGKIFTKIGREITVCVKEGGPDPSSNAKLRDLIAKAKSNNVPNDNIDRVIKKAAGEGDKNNYESIVYEGYGPCGVAVIVECLTDNKNRTAGNIELFKTILHHDSIMYLSTGELQYQRVAESIHYRMDFGRSSPSADSDMLMIIISRSPFFAPALDRCAFI